MKNAVCFFFTFFVEAVILYQYASTLFIPKRVLKIRFTVLFGLYVFLYAVSMLNYMWLNTFLYLFANFIFLLTQYRLKWYSAFFHSTVLTAAMGACELTVYSALRQFAPHYYAESLSYYNFPIMLTFIILSKIIFFTVIYIFMHFMKGRREDEQQHDHSELLLVFILLTSVFIILTFLTVNDAYPLSPDLVVIITLDAVFLLIVNFLVFGINQYNRKKNAKFTEMQLLLQKEANLAEYYQMLFSQNENQSILIHDIKKHLQSINLLNEQREYDKISAYIRQLMLSSDLKESARLCDHELLNTILCRYQRQCGSMQISFHVDIRHGILDFIADSDITSLFGNLLDNAVEATSGIPEAFIEVNAARRSKAPFTVITVINSCRKNPFSGPQGTLTTKKQDKRKHGFGIKSIQKTVSKYHGDLQMYYHNDTLTFHTIISIKIPDRDASPESNT